MKQVDGGTEGIGAMDTCKDNNGSGTTTTEKATTTTTAANELTVGQAAAYLQVSASSIHAYIRQGKLRAFRVAGLREVLIPKGELRLNRASAVPSEPTLVLPGSRSAHRSRQAPGSPDLRVIISFTTFK
jgi:excisionase family DNA binding protein